MLHYATIKKKKKKELQQKQNKMTSINELLKWPEKRGSPEAGHYRWSCPVVPVLTISCAMKDLVSTFSL